VSLEIIPVWKEITPELEAELVEFWLSNKVIADEQRAVERAKWVVCLARSEQGAIIGVSTALPRVVPRLRQPMYVYRNLIVADFRNEQLAAAFLDKTRQVLQAYNLALPEPRCLGIMIANPGLAAHRNEAQWQEGPTFIGYSPRGLPLRVWYFDGARLFAPAPLRQRRAAA
jgi:hypothetical protein